MNCMNLVVCSLLTASHLHPFCHQFGFGINTSVVKELQNFKRMFLTRLSILEVVFTLLLLFLLLSLFLFLSIIIMIWAFLSRFCHSSCLCLSLWTAVNSAACDTEMTQDFETVFIRRFLKRKEKTI